MRIRKTIFRLKRFWKNIEKEKQMQRIRNASLAANSEATTLNDITWDIYGNICEFLDVQDMARMSQLNKKFWELNKREVYWENQYNRDWKNKIPYGKDRSFKEKCIEGFKQVKRKNKVLTQEERDITFGTYYILFEEMLKSFYLSPHYLLLPAKLIGYLAYKFDRTWNVESIFQTEGYHYADAIKTDPFLNLKFTQAIEYFNQSSV